MKSFIYSIIKIIVFTIVFLILLSVFSNLYTYMFLRENDISVADSVSYIISPNEETSTFTSKEYINLTTPDNTYIDNTNNISVVNNVDYFYYNQLDNYSKIIYDALENNISNLKKENYTISFGTKFDKLLNQTNGDKLLNYYFQSALDAFFYDHPELFYIDLTNITLLIKYTTISSQTTYVVSLIPRDNKSYLSDSFKTEADANQAIAKVESIKNNIIASLPNDSDYNKILKIHDILINSIEYNSDNANSHNIYGALIEKKVVCEGYAKAFKYILDELNIECILVNGTATNSNNQTEAHMWNYIKLDNNWYGVDLTWNDPIVVGGFSKNTIRHDYFCKGRTVFNKSHNESNQISNTGMVFSLPNLSYENYK